MALGTKGTGSGGGQAVDQLAGQLRDLVGVIRFLQDPANKELIDRLDERIVLLTERIAQVGTVDRIDAIRADTERLMKEAQDSLTAAKA